MILWHCDTGLIAKNRIVAMPQLLHREEVKIQTVLKKRWERQTVLLRAKHGARMKKSPYLCCVIKQTTDYSQRTTDVGVEKGRAVRSEQWLISRRKRKPTQSIHRYRLYVAIRRQAQAKQVRNSANSAKSAWDKNPREWNWKLKVENCLRGVIAFEHELPRMGSWIAKNKIYSW